MQQLTSSEAHKLALEALSNEYDEVVSMIKKEAEKGKNTITIKNLNPTIQNELQNNGFDIRQITYTNDSVTTLYW